MKQSKQIPLGVKFVAIIFSVLSVAAVVSSIVAMFYLTSVFLEGDNTCGGFGCWFPIEMLLIGAIVILFVLGILNFFIARGILCGREWARILAIILLVILSFYLFEFGLIVFSIMSIVITGSASYYLLFNKSSIEFFSRKN